MQMEESRYQTSRVVGITHSVCVQSILEVAKNVEGVSLSDKSDTTLSERIELANNVVEHELIRRYGA